MKKYLLLIGALFLLISCGKEVTSDFTMDRIQIQAGETVNFTNLSLDAEHYHWKFGDGSTSREVNPSHTFTKAGTLMVHLHASNKGGDRWDDAYREIRVTGYYDAFIDNWGVTEDYTSTTCGSGNHLYTMNIRHGDKADEVWVDNFGDMFAFPVRGRSPYLAPNKIEFNESNLMTKSGEMYNLVGNFVITGAILDINYTLTPTGETPTACGTISADGTGIAY